MLFLSSSRNGSSGGGGNQKFYFVCASPTSDSSYVEQLMKNNWNGSQSNDFQLISKAFDPSGFYVYRNAHTNNTRYIYDEYTICSSLR